MYTVYFGHFFIWQNKIKFIHKIYISLVVYETTREIYKICEQYYNHYVGWTNGQTTKINFIDHEKLIL
jgi:hypothetical protein